MPRKRFQLSARISSNNTSGIKTLLKKFIGKQGTIKPTDDGFEIKAVLEGESARELNRKLLSEMRRVEKRTRLRAEWTHDDTMEKFFDYVPKGTSKVHTP
jgi:ribosomal protein S20